MKFLLDNVNVMPDQTNVAYTTLFLLRFSRHNLWMGQTRRRLSLIQSLCQTEEHVACSLRITYIFQNFRILDFICLASLLEAGYFLIVHMVN